MSKFNKEKYIFLLVFQCAIFGIDFIVVKMLLENALPIFFLLAFRFFIGTFALLPFCYKNSSAQQTTIKVTNKKETRYGIVAGLVFFAAFGLQTIGAYYTTPAKNGVFTGLYVIFVPAIIMLITRKFVWKPLLYAIVCFFGVMVVSNFFSEQLTINIGDILTIACAIAFAGHFILLEKFLVNSKINFYRFTAIQILIAAILSFAISLVFERSTYNTIHWDYQIILLLLFLGIIGTALTYFIQTIVQSKISANTVSIISCSESVFAVSFALCFGFDKFSFSLLFGTIIISVAMVLTSVSNEKYKIKYSQK